MKKVKWAAIGFVYFVLSSHEFNTYFLLNVTVLLEFLRNCEVLY